MHPDFLISHAQNSVALAKQELSKLNNEILSVRGMSTKKIRHLVNNLCNFEDCKYLEIGLFKGSTFCSALFNNKVVSACGIDNYCEFENENEGDLTVKQVFDQNLQKFLPNRPEITVLNENSFTTTPPENDYNVYFYDGGHLYQDQYLAYYKLDKYLNKYFITLVDDWIAWTGDVKHGTYQSFRDLNYKILWEEELPQGDFHSGQLIAVIEKQ